MEAVTLAALAFALGVTLVANWLVSRARREAERMAAEIEAYKAANPPVVMPRISVDQEMRITGMDWDLGTVESGGSRVLAVPKIPRMGRQVLRMTGEKMQPTYWEVDFVAGEIRQIDEGEYAWRSDLPGRWGLN